MQYQNISSAPVQIAYALKDSKLFHISAVEKGLACGCVCPKCKEPLKARKGPKRKHHFAHLPGSECLGAAETILHQLAKEVIANLSWIQIPEYHYQRKKQLRDGRLITHEKLIAKGGKVTIDKVEIEQNIGEIRPDIVVFFGNKPLAIEIAVTHKSERKKKRTFRKYDIPAIEIELSEYYAMHDPRLLGDLIQKETKIKKWLFHPKQVSEDQEFVAMVRSGLAEIRDSRRRYRGFEIAYNPSPYTRPYFENKQVSYRHINQAERVAEEFKAIKGRYPSRDEMLRYWPELFKPKLS